MATHSKSIEAMIAANTKRTSDKLAAVRAAIQSLIEDPRVREINPSVVGAVQGTPSRQFIYNNGGDKAAQRGLRWDLLKEIQDAQRNKNAQLANVGNSPNETGSTVLGLRAQNKTYQARIETLREELKNARHQIDDLKKQKRLALGAKLESRILIDPAEHQSVIKDNNWLNDQLRLCRHEIKELRTTQTQLSESVQTLREINGALVTKLGDRVTTENIIDLGGRR